VNGHVRVRMYTLPVVKADGPTWPSWCSDCLSYRGPVGVGTFDVYGG
jgi:hypothetical protein